MTQFLEDQNRGGLKKATITIEEITQNFDRHTNKEFEAQELAKQDQYRKEEEKKQQWRDINRLGGLKAYNNFTLVKYNNKSAIKLCAGYPKQNLYLWGAAGTGKTHLATALMRTYQEARIVKPQTIYRDCRGLKDSEAEQAAIDKFIHAPYLVIDDLGQDKRTDWSFSTLYEIIEGRDMWEMQGLIITSNFSLTDLAKRMDSDCIISRINGLCKIIEITGKDKRMEAR